MTVAEAKHLAAGFRFECNNNRPHSSLGYKTLHEFAAGCAPFGSASLRLRAHIRAVSQPVSLLCEWTKEWGQVTGSPPLRSGLPVGGTLSALIWSSCTRIRPSALITKLEIGICLTHVDTEGEAQLPTRKREAHPGINAPSVSSSEWSDSECRARWRHGHAMARSHQS